MAQYGALTDSFRELNHLLISQQEREGQMALNAAAKEHQHAVLMSQLEQQAFNNVMAQKNFQLAERGEDRLAAKQIEDLRQWTIKNARDEKIHTNNLKRFGMDQQLHAIEMERAEREKKAQNIRMENMLREAELAEQATRISDLNFNSVLTQDQLENVPLMDALNVYTNDVYGFSVRPDGVATSDDEPGSTIQMKAYEQANVFGGAQAIIDQHENRAMDVSKNIAELEAQHSALNSVVQDNADNYNFNERAAAKREMNRLAPQIQLQKDYFKPENMLQYHQDKVIQLQRHADWLRGVQQEGRADAMDETIKHHRDIAEALAEEIAEGTETGKVSVDGLKQHSLYKTELDAKGRPIYVGQGVYDVGKAAKGEPAWSYVDEGVPTTDMTALPEDVQVGKPTERTTTTSAGSPRDDIDVKTMLNFKDLIKTEGATAMWTSNEGKLLHENLKHLATVLKATEMAGSNSPNLFAQRESVSFFQNTLDEYYTEIDSIDENFDTDDPNMAWWRPAALKKTLASLKEMRAEADAEGRSDKYKQMLSRRIKNLQTVGNNKKRQKILLKKFAELQHEESWRERTGDYNMVVFKPNDTIKGFLYGEGMMGFNQ